MSRRVGWVADNEGVSGSTDNAAERTLEITGIDEIVSDTATCETATCGTTTAKPACGRPYTDIVTRKSHKCQHAKWLSPNFVKSRSESLRDFAKMKITSRIHEELRAFAKSFANSRNEFREFSKLFELLRRALRIHEELRGIAKSFAISRNALSKCAKPFVNSRSNLRFRKFAKSFS